MKVIEYLKQYGFLKLYNKYCVQSIEFFDADQNKLYILNYNPCYPFYYSPEMKFHEIVKECQGLILDSELNIVSRSFHTIFHYSELSPQHLQELKLDEPFQTRFRIVEQMDGHRIQIYYRKSNWYISTQTNPFGEEKIRPFENNTVKQCVLKALHLEEETAFQNFCNLYFEKDLTYIFELTPPRNKVVAPYDTYSLWYLGCRHNDSNGAHEYKYIRSSIIKYPTRYSFSSLEACIESARKLPFNQKGYMIYNVLSKAPIVTVRSPSYVNFYNIDQEPIMGKKAIVRRIASGKHKTFLKHYPEKKWDFEPYLVKINNYLRNATNIYEKYNKMYRNDERKFIFEIKDFTFAWIAFRARKTQKDFWTVYREMILNQKVLFILKKILTPEMILCIGIIGSGKSSFAREYEESYGYVHINRNDVPSKEQKANEYCEKKWNLAKSLCQNVIISDCNLKEEDQKIWEKRARDNGYIVTKKYFQISIEEAWERDSKRHPFSVGREEIIRQYEQWLKITNRRRYQPNTENPKAILCDIDGTIAMALHRNIFDFSRVSTDEPRTDIIDMIVAWINSQKHEIIFLTGRDSSCFSATQSWIEKWMGVPVGEQNLFMRESGDQRKDREVKEEIFWKYIARNYNVVAVVDDRPQVIRMWHDIGIENVINVQKGYNEF